MPSIATIRTAMRMPMTAPTGKDDESERTIGAMLVSVSKGSGELDADGKGTATDFDAGSEGEGEGEAAADGLGDGARDGLGDGEATGGALGAGDGAGKTMGGSTLGDCAAIETTRINAANCMFEVNKRRLHPKSQQQTMVCLRLSLASVLDYRIAELLELVKVAVNYPTVQSLECLYCSCRSTRLYCSVESLIYNYYSSFLSNNLISKFTP